MATCPRCGAENRAQARFCDSCGSLLEAAPAATREVRKVVTVLFCDLAGSTRLGEQLDPESLRRLLARYFDEAKTVLEHHGGTVEKFIGDAVMAVFGVPTVHEDDALRAVRAASELRERLASLNEEFGRTYGVKVETRTGINTGEVVTGTGERLATGDAVNVAARLEQHAAPGEILIGEATHRLVRDAVRVGRLRPLDLEGKQAAVGAYPLLSVAAEAPGVARRLDAPLVGRSSERRLLSDAYERAARERACHLVTVLGPAGIGKSRLAAEVARAVASEATVLSGRCLSYGEGITFWPVRDILRQAMHRERAERVEDLVRGRLHPQFGRDADAIARRIAVVTGQSDETVSNEETFWAVRKLLEEIARERPLVLIVDDIQWAEPTLLDLLDHVADWSRDAPILLLCLARPELLDKRPTWAGGKLNATSLYLEPLTAAESAQLTAGLAARAAAGSDVVTRIAAASEGNPLFVEQMLAMLEHEGGPNGELAIPPTIQALLAARLDSLTAGERSAVERAAVCGKEFDLASVVALSPPELRPDVPAHVLALVRKELVRPETDGDRFRFRHDLIRDAAYQALPKERRAELHERFADAVELEAGERLPELEEIVGYHLEQAHRYLAELGPVGPRGSALARRAADRLGRAGSRALTRGDARAAVNLLARARSLLSPTEPPARQLTLKLAEALQELGELDSAHALFGEAVEVARAAGDRGAEWRARVLRASGTMQRDPATPFERGLDEGRAGIRVFSELGDEAGLALAWRVVGTTEFFLGRAGAAQEALARAAELARSARLLRDEIEALTWLGGALIYGPTPASEGIRRLEAMVGGGAILEAGALRGLAVFKAMLGRFDEARRDMRRWRAVLEDLGQELRLAAAGFWEGGVEFLAGDLPAAERALRESVERLTALGETGYLSTLAAHLADCVYLQGRYGEARELTELSESSSAPDDVASQVVWRRVRAKALGRSGALEPAERLARDAVSLSETSDYLVYRGDALADLAEVLVAASRCDEAARALERAVELYERKEDVTSAARARKRLATL